MSVSAIRPVQVPVNQSTTHAPTTEPKQGLAARVCQILTAPFRALVALVRTVATWIFNLLCFCRKPPADQTKQLQEKQSEIDQLKKQLQQAATSQAVPAQSPAPLHTTHKEKGITRMEANADTTIRTTDHMQKQLQQTPAPIQSAAPTQITSTEELVRRLETNADDVIKKAELQQNQTLQLEKELTETRQKAEEEVTKLRQELEQKNKTHQELQELSEFEKNADAKRITDLQEKLAALQQELDGAQQATDELRDSVIEQQEKYQKQGIELHEAQAEITQQLLSNLEVRERRYEAALATTQSVRIQFQSLRTEISQLATASKSNFKTKINAIIAQTSQVEQAIQSELTKLDRVSEAGRSSISRLKTATLSRSGPVASTSESLDE